MDLSVQLAPKHKTGLRLANPVMTASGTFGYGTESSHMFDIQTLASKIGIRWGYNTLISNRRNGSKVKRVSDESITQFYLELNQKYPELLQEYRELKNIPLPKDSDPVCGAGKNGVRIGPDGKVYPCIEINKTCGDLLADSFAEIWRHSPILKKIREIATGQYDICKRCEFFNFCNQRCPGRFEAHSGSYFQPDEETCRNVRLSHKAQAGVFQKQDCI